MPENNYIGYNFQMLRIVFIFGYAINVVWFRKSVLYNLLRSLNPNVVLYSVATLFDTKLKDNPFKFVSMNNQQHLTGLNIYINNCYNIFVNIS